MPRQERVQVWLAACMAILLGLGGCATNHPERQKALPEEELREKQPRIARLTLGPGDEIEIAVWRNRELDGKYVLDASGRIFMPLVGVLEVSGLDPFELMKLVVAKLSRYLLKPQVRVSVTAYRSQKIFVLGEVRKPGVFYLRGGISSLSEVVARSGGFTEDASRKSVLVIKGGLESGDVRAYNMKELFEKGDWSQNPVLSKGDIVYVPATFISKVDRFFMHLKTIVTPVVEVERLIILEPLVEDVLQGESSLRIVIR